MPQQKNKTKRGRWDPMEPENDDVHTWVHAGGFSVIVKKMKPDDAWPYGRVMLYINTPRNSIGLNLSGFREDELRAIAFGVYKAFEVALPVSQEYDTESQRRFDEGETFQLRIYRSVPLVLSVEGYEQGNGEGVPERPAPVALEYRGSIGQHRVRKRRAGVAHRPPQRMETADYIAQDRDHSHDGQVPGE